LLHKTALYTLQKAFQGIYYTLVMIFMPNPEASCSRTRENTHKQQHGGRKQQQPRGFLCGVVQTRLHFFTCHLPTTTQHKHQQHQAARAAPPAPLYKMPPVKPWPATTDPGTEEAVPGLAPTDGYAINATTPNLEPLAPMLEYARPIGDIMHAFMGAMNVSESHPELPGHADKRTTVTLLVPNAEALMKLPVQLSRTNVLAARAQGLMDKLAHPKAAAADLAAAARDAAASVLPKSLNVSGLPPQGYGNATKATDSVARQLVAANTITRMVPFQYLTNATVGLETQAGAPVKVIVRCVLL
jgi:hypothetical protein